MEMSDCSFNECVCERGNFTVIASSSPQLFCESVSLLYSTPDKMCQCMMCVMTND